MARKSEVRSLPNGSHRPCNLGKQSTRRLECEEGLEALTGTICLWSANQVGRLRQIWSKWIWCLPWMIDARRVRYYLRASFEQFPIGLLRYCSKGYSLWTISRVISCYLSSGHESNKLAIDWDNLVSPYQEKGENLCDLSVSIWADTVDRNTSRSPANANNPLELHFSYNFYDSHEGRFARTSVHKLSKHRHRSRLI
jgi:hypothetical protein